MSDTTDAMMKAVASVLAVTILLDKRTRDAEMVEFCHSIMTINQKLRPGVILPRKTILAWFEAHKAEFTEALAADSDDSFKIATLSSVTDPELQRTVLAAIFAISICDYEFRDEEADFIKMALKAWKTDMPHAEEMALLAG